ncbi:MAG TPA: type II restriction endonuclease [Treponemataceae bacterium]|nr:type II restriction endonuclease [Treponemataceae bacterium]
MNISTISNLFKIVVAKHLSAVDSEPSRSHGHEIGGLSTLHSFIKKDTRVETVRYVYVGKSDIVSVDGWATWYDARANDSKRSPEWRMYYQDNEVTTSMVENDFLLIGLLHDESMIFLVVDKESENEQAICTLFGIQEIRPKGFTVIDTSERKTAIGMLERSILDSIGIEYEYTDATFLEDLLDKFDGVFPSTEKFSAYARKSLNFDIEFNDVDKLLVQYIDREELFFRTLEKYQVENRLKKGFEGVEDFISYSLSIQNRRKSRAGHALENHLESIFSHLDVKFNKGVRTEGYSKPDFLFPGKKNYDDLSFSASGLIMLAVKTTCKDRWRQILAEASRIPVKHLLTLQSSISNEQTSEMKRQNVQLIVPANLHVSYTDLQRQWLWTLQDFITFVLDKQKK